MAAQLRSEITIDATPGQVWATLTDFAAYPDWNPFVRRIDGAPVAGTRLEAHLQPPDGRGMTFRPTVLVADPDRELRWLGHFGVPGLFDGEHRFRIERASDKTDGVRFIQEERFTGLLAPLMLRFIGAATLKGFEAMNLALKTRVEQKPADAR